MDLQIVLFILSALLAIVGALLTIVGSLVLIFLKGILTEIKNLRADMSLALQAQAVLRTIVDGLPCRSSKCSEAL